MIKKFLKTFIIVVIVFFIIIFISLLINVKEKLNKQVCTLENSACPENSICNFKEKICVQAEKCQGEKPEICITLYSPVCSEGKEYSNSCYACSAGVKLYYQGKC